MTRIPDKPYVLDTNILVSALSENSRFGLVIDSLLNSDFEVAVSPSIVLEYEEVLKRKFDNTAVDDFLQAVLNLPNVHLVDPEFNMQLIHADPDDNNFVDCDLLAMQVPS